MCTLDLSRDFLNVCNYQRPWLQVGYQFRHLTIRTYLSKVRWAQSTQSAANSTQSDAKIHNPKLKEHNPTLIVHNPKLKEHNPKLIVHNPELICSTQSEAESQCKPWHHSDPTLAPCWLRLCVRLSRIMRGTWTFANSWTRWKGTWERRIAR
jgi:hypothetical protein